MEPEQPLLKVTRNTRKIAWWRLTILYGLQFKCTMCAPKQLTQWINEAHENPPGTWVQQTVCFTPTHFHCNPACCTEKPRACLKEQSTFLMESWALTFVSHLCLGLLRPPSQGPLALVQMYIHVNPHNSRALRFPRQLIWRFSPSDPNTSELGQVFPHLPSNEFSLI